MSGCQLCSSPPAPSPAAPSWPAPSAGTPPASRCVSRPFPRSAVPPLPTAGADPPTRPPRACFIKPTKRRTHTSHCPHFLPRHATDAAMSPSALDRAACCPASALCWLSSPEARPRITGFEEGVTHARIRYIKQLSGFLCSGTRHSTARTRRPQPAYENMRLHSGVAKRGSDSCTHSSVCRSCAQTSFRAQPAPAGAAARGRGDGTRHQWDRRPPAQRPPPTPDRALPASKQRPPIPQSLQAPSAPPSPPKMSSWSDGPPPRLLFSCTCAQEKSQRGSGDRPRTGSWRHVRDGRSNSQRSPMGRVPAAAPGAPAHIQIKLGW